MSDLTLPAPKVENSVQLGRIVTLVALAAAIAILIFPKGLSAFSHYPDSLVIPFKEWIGALMLWLKVNFTWATRALAAVIDLPLRFAFGLLAKGFKFGGGDQLPPFIRNQHLEHNADEHG